jgi:hypothetical protein
VLGGSAWNYSSTMSISPSSALLIRTGPSGAVLWSRIYGGNDTAFYSIQQTSDGGYICAGVRTLFNNKSRLTIKTGYFLLKADSKGTPSWNKTYGGTRIDAATSVQQTFDGGYIIAGCSNSYGVGDVWLVKTDQNGNMIWNQTYPDVVGSLSDLGSYFGNAPHVQQTLDGGYIISGVTFFGPSDAILIKTNETGSIAWKSTYGEGCANYVQQTLDGGYIMVGTTTGPTGYPYAWLVKTHLDGSLQWSKTYGGDAPMNTFGNYVEQTPDGGYMLAGKFLIDAWYGLVLATDSNGTVKSSRAIPETSPIYSGKDVSGPICAKLTKNGECVLAATTRSYDITIPGSSNNWQHFNIWLGIINPPQLATAQMGLLSLSIALAIEITACVILLNKKSN